MAAKLPQLRVLTLIVATLLVAACKPAAHASSTKSYVGANANSAEANPNALPPQNIVMECGSDSEAAAKGQSPGAVIELNVVREADGTYRGSLLNLADEPNWPNGVAPSSTSSSVVGSISSTGDVQISLPDQKASLTASRSARESETMVRTGDIKMGDDTPLPQAISRGTLSLDHGKALAVGCTIYQDMGAQNASSSNP